MALKVVVNAGHAKNNPTAPGDAGAPIFGGGHEALVTKAISEKLCALSDAEINYVYKRQSPIADGLLDLLKVLRFYRPPIVLSIHVNAAAMPMRKCIHRADILYNAGDPDQLRRSRSQRLAEMLEHAACASGGFAESAKIIEAPYARADDPHFTPGILVNTASIAMVLCEVGYGTDAHVGPRLLQADFQYRIAKVIDAALRAFVKTLT